MNIGYNGMTIKNDVVFQHDRTQNVMEMIDRTEERMRYIQVNLANGLKPCLEMLKNGDVLDNVAMQLSKVMIEKLLLVHLPQPYEHGTGRKNLNCRMQRMRDEK